MKDAKGRDLEGRGMIEGHEKPVVMKTGSHLLSLTNKWSLTGKSWGRKKGEPLPSYHKRIPRTRSNGTLLDA